MPWMQKVALEKNLSETAFVEMLREEKAGDDSPSRYALRWFTPVAEVDLCGHATLGAAHALWATGRVAKRRRIEFETKASGVLTCELLPEGGWIEMDFPADPPSIGEEAKQASLPSAATLAKALGVDVSGVVAVGKGRFDVLCELTQAEFDRMKPAQDLLSAIDCRGVVVTTKGCEGSQDAERASLAAAAVTATPGAQSRLAIDFRSRFFGPRVGVPEDPVTGSAHCMLAPYWAKRLGIGGDGAMVVGFQASARGGIVRCKLQGGRVKIAGPCVTTLEGTLQCG